MGDYTLLGLTKLFAGAETALNATENCIRLHREYAGRPMGQSLAQRMNSHNRMMIGIGTPTSHRINERNISTSKFAFHTNDRSVKRFRHKTLAASSTCLAWSRTRTFSQIRAIFPSASIRNVDRTTPMYLRP